MSKPTIYLASTSPRRRQLLRQLKIKFRPIRPTFIEPRVKTSHHPKKFAITCAFFKAFSAWHYRKIKAGLIVGMDTIVVLRNHILGKPSTVSEATRTIKMLSGKRHYVVTGVAVIKLPSMKVVTGSESTAVTFRNLSSNEIDEYIRTGEPFDKAGAYAIQGRGALFIEKVDGCYLNVIGLPVPLLFRLLNQIEKISG
ncbi:MAG: Maf family protein [bacterium]